MISQAWHEASRFCQLGLSLLLLLVAAVPAGAATYVDRTLGELSAERRTPLATPQPVQLLFNFTTDDVPNAQATKFLKDYVTQQVIASGRFSTVTETPAENGALLNVSINNITEKGAAGKGFKVGLTFGLAGTVVTDTYRIRLDYALGPASPAIVQTVEHRLLTKIGAKSPPENADKAKNLVEAIHIVVRQALDHGLNALAADPGFSPVLAAEQPPAAPVVTP